MLKRIAARLYKLAVGPIDDAATCRCGTVSIQAVGRYRLNPAEQHRLTQAAATVCEKCTPAPHATNW